MGAVATVEPRAVAVSEGRSLITTIAELARDPTFDAAKAQALANLAIQLQDRERQAEFNRDLNTAIMTMPRVKKDGKIVIPANPQKGTPERVQGHYAKFENLDRVVRPILMQHNLAIRFEVGTGGGGQVTVRPIISHSNGFVERGDAMSLPIDSSGSKNNTQGVGSSTSYGKRYAMCAALNIVVEGEDADGRGEPEAQPLSDAQQALLDNAELAVAKGLPAYQEWFTSLDVAQRKWLSASGHHDKLKGKAK